MRWAAKGHAGAKKWVRDFALSPSRQSITGLTGGLDGSRGYGRDRGLLSPTCPTCFEVFEVAVPHPDEMPAEVDYDCEVCCRPMVIVFTGDDVYARGLAE